MKRVHLLIGAAIILSFAAVAVVTSGAFAGHLAILAVTVGIFLGTLSLGRTPAPKPQISELTPLPLATAVSIGRMAAATPLPDIDPGPKA